jgi:hypothetical protein
MFHGVRTTDITRTIAQTTMVQITILAPLWPHTQIDLFARQKAHFVLGIGIFEQGESLVGFGNQLFAENCVSV